jgi:formyltetrahydrofolate deformylase
MTTAHILTLSCGDRPGLVAAVTSMLFENGGNILEAQQFDDLETGRFFMRVLFDLPGESDELRGRFADLARRHGMDWRLRARDERRKVMLLVSKFDHCLGDLLYRMRIGEMAMDVVGIVSNHPKEALNVSMIGDIPFHHLPVTKETKPRQEAEIRRLVTESGAEIIVLARYMQILSDDLAGFLEGRCVNIHHSFLPGFKGAKPYHQAHARGVKMIGATAHFVTADLDEGPMLARAVHHLLDDRVLLNGVKTVVFAG